MVEAKAETLLRARRLGELAQYPAALKFALRPWLSKLLAARPECATVGDFAAALTEVAAAETRFAQTTRSRARADDGGEELVSELCAAGCVDLALLLPTVRHDAAGAAAALRAAGDGYPRHDAYAEGVSRFVLAQQPARGAELAAAFLSEAL